MRLKTLWHVITEPEAVPMYYGDETKHEAFYEKSQAYKGFSHRVYAISNIAYYEHEMPIIVKKVLVKFI